jgi:hypothetical protein
MAAAAAVTRGELDAGTGRIFFVEDIERGQTDVGDFLLSNQHSRVVLRVAGWTG